MNSAWPPPPGSDVLGRNLTFDIFLLAFVVLFAIALLWRSRHGRH